MSEPISHDPVLQSKINSACSLIEKTLEAYEKPAILCSFGKDSMLMLHMIREWFTKDLPVIFLKQPYFPRKFAFADRIAADWELEIHTAIPPVGVSVTSKNGRSELVQHFQMKHKQLLRPIGKQNIEGHPKWLCSKETFANGPFGSSAWPWDVAFCGHKSSDTDPVQGEVPLSVDIHQIAGSCDLAYPIRHFTDEDVWTLTKAWSIPFNRLRYDDDELLKGQDSFWNDDYIPYCNRCLDPNEPDFVTCPKTGLQISNISSSLAQVDPKLAYCKGI